MRSESASRVTLLPRRYRGSLKKEDLIRKKHFKNFVFPTTRQGGKAKN